MATTTYVPIATVTANGSSVYLEATNIPSTYTDLVVVLNIKESGQDGLNIQMGNGSYDTGSNYSNTFVQGNGSSAGSGRASNQTYAEIGIESNEWGNTILHFQNYANTNVYKTILSRTNSTNFLMRAVVATWRSTSAIERIRIYNGSNANHSAGSTMTLYGIANAQIEAPKATGGIITYDNTYFYHTFGASGTFTPQQSLTADILVVAGGGGGGRYKAGGGGAGGLLGFASQSLSATGYTVTVGAGGAGGTNAGSGAQNGTNGGDSQFGALTLVKGGGGGGGAYGASNSAGATGGSGGGGNGDASTAGGSPTTSQGFAGSAGSSGNGGGGGGSAEAGGTDGTGEGGDGVSTYSSYGLVTGTGENVSGTVYYAGGGGGGNNTANRAGGLGGGGIGGNTIAATAGLANTGGGGGGGAGDNFSSNYTGANGGSGVVIIRYLKA